jgi:Ca-activated chloride channel family protein
MRFWWLLLLLPDVAMAKPGSWPRLYNNGVTAYQSNDFARAAALFENATSSTDRALQQRALYNLGNTSYRLGQAQPAQAQPLWQRALKNYETALAIDPKDADAKFNHDLVKKKLEELKKQQQEQQQNQKNQQDKKQDQKRGDEQQQQQKQDQQQNKPDDKQSDQKQEQQPQPSQEQQQKQPIGRGKPEQPEDQQRQNEQQQQQAQQDKPSPPEQQLQANGGQPQDYDKMQAAALLDELREDERNWNFFPEVQMKDLKNSGEPAKDW